MEYKGHKIIVRGSFHLPYVWMCTLLSSLHPFYAFQMWLVFWTGNPLYDLQWCSCRAVHLIDTQCFLANSFIMEISHNTKDEGKSLLWHVNNWSCPLSTKMDNHKPNIWFCSCCIYIRMYVSVLLMWRKEGTFWHAKSLNQWNKSNVMMDSTALVVCIP